MSLFGNTIEPEVNEADYKEKTTKISPFDFLKSINETKEDLMVEDRSEPQYQPFIVNRGLSFGKDTVLYANAMNSMHHLDKRLQYDFLRYAIRRGKRYNKWLKSEEQNLETVMKYYGYSFAKAKDAMKILSPEDLAEMQSWLDKSKGGSL